MLKWIIEKIQGVSISKISDLIPFADPNKYNRNIQFWSKINGFVQSFEFKDSEEFIKLSDMEGVAAWFQKSLDLDTRKIYAANYTSLAAIDLLKSIFPTTVPTNIIDPFCGSGRLIIGILDNLESNSSYPKITMNEYMPFACILAYYNLLKHFIKANESINKITIYLGDAFTNLRMPQREKFDLIVMNPPFTRVHRINSETKNALESVKNSYPGLISGQPGLHYYALLLADSLLNKNGTLVSILPGSTFVSVYSKPLMEFYLDNYKIDKIIKFKESSAFSDGSSLKEVIFVSNKQIKSQHFATSFEVIDVKNGLTIEKGTKIPSQQLRVNWNWLKYFESEQLLNLEIMFLENPIIQSGEDLKLNISRGIEMYGPNFFCLPNSEWALISTDEKIVTIKQSKDKKEISIPIEFLQKSLRKSGLYKNRISPSINEYILSVPKSDTLDDNIILYSQINKHNSQVAQKKFGIHWIHHTSDQIRVKQPFGNLFFIDKLSLESSGVMCHFLEETYSATKNFYVMKGSIDELKLQAAWINSSCFLILYIVNRREIGSKLGRMQIIDLMNTRMFVDTKLISTGNKQSIIEQFDKFRYQNLPRIPDQIGKDYRMALDREILLALGFSKSKIPSIIDDIYNIMRIRFSNN
ncbi:MAG: N-6 DNA methylase [Candidatus Heimdallarchaeota archaeon]|nr:N-6 DNA methylase [Candidatus Heimdallarchaeota archaeon]